jgi:hypothetical protein
MPTFFEKEHRQHRVSPGIRAKLKVNTPGDAYEREADLFADRVSGAGSIRGVSPIPALSVRNAGSAPALVEAALQTPGQPLDAPTRDFMKTRFGHDFSRVRVHSDAQAAAAAQSIDALAYTAGQDVVFGQGQYAPNLAAGRHLLAHELAHVAQQARGGAPVVQRKTFFGPDEKAGAPADWAAQVAAAATSTDRAKLIQTALGTGVTVIDKTAAGAADSSPTAANLVEYSAASQQVNYDDGLNTKKSPVDSRLLNLNAAYTLESGGKYYVILGPKSLDGGRYTYPIVILNHEFDHVRQGLGASALKGNEAELDAWTSSFVRDFHRTYRLSETAAGGTCYVESVSTWTQLLDYYQRSGVSTTQQDASVKRIKDYYNTTIKTHEGHKAAFHQWLYITLKNASVTVNIADKINMALGLGISASDDVMKYRKFTCGSTIQTLAYTAPGIDKPTFPAPKPAATAP